MRNPRCSARAATPFGPAPPPRQSDAQPTNPDLDEIILNDAYYASLGLTRDEARRQMAWAAAEEDPAGLDLFEDAFDDAGVSEAYAASLTDAAAELQTRPPQTVAQISYGPPVRACVRACACARAAARVL